VCESQWLTFRLCISRIKKTHRIAPRAGVRTRSSFERFPLFPLLFWYKFYNEHFYSIVFLRIAGTKIWSRYHIRWDFWILLYSSTQKWTSKRKWTHVQKKTHTKRKRLPVPFPAKKSRFPDLSENWTRDLLKLGILRARGLTTWPSERQNKRFTLSTWGESHRLYTRWTKTTPDYVARAT